MIYGDDPDFDTLIQELRTLNLQLVATGHAKDINEIIQTALQQIKDPGVEGTSAQTPVIYVSDHYLPKGPANVNVQFMTEFIRKASGWVLHRIHIFK